jgi:tetratricopeptide (TPR) repeat protein
MRQRVAAAILAAKLPPKAAPPVETAKIPIDAKVDPKVALPLDPKIVTTKPTPDVEVPKNVEKVADVKPGIPEPKNKNRKKDPKECLEWRSKFLQRAETRIQQFETKRNFVQIIELAYKMEDYQRVVAVLERVLREGSVNGRDNEVWLAAVAWEVGLLIPNSNPQKLDVLVKNWKSKALAAIENVKLDEQENRWTRWDTPHSVATVEEREAFFKSWQKPLQDDLKKMELAGEDDPKYLWDLAMRYQDQKKPWIPLRYMNMLLKLRAWHDDFAHVKSGEVQVRLARLLSEQFGLPPEAIVEATSVVDKYPKHAAVVSGEICWILAENNLALAKDQQMNKDKVPYYEEAKKYYDQYRKIAHAHNNKIHPGAHQSETQRKLEDVNSNLSRMKPKN